MLQNHAPCYRITLQEASRVSVLQNHAPCCRITLRAAPCVSVLQNHALGGTARVHVAESRCGWHRARSRCWAERPAGGGAGGAEGQQEQPTTYTLFPPLLCAPSLHLSSVCASGPNSYPEVSSVFTYCCSCLMDRYWHLNTSMVLMCVY